MGCILMLNACIKIYIFQILTFKINANLNHFMPYHYKQYYNLSVYSKKPIYNLTLCFSFPHAREIEIVESDEQEECDKAMENSYLVHYEISQQSFYSTTYKFPRFSSASTAKPKLQGSSFTAFVTNSTKLYIKEGHRGRTMNICGRAWSEPCG